MHCRRAVRVAVGPSRRRQRWDNGRPMASPTTARPEAGTANGTPGVTHLLAPHLPRLSIDWITTRVDEVHRLEPGTVVFVDISGFTKLSEGLAKHGKVGAEELTATIGSCFVELLDLAVAYGGRLLEIRWRRPAPLLLRRCPPGPGVPGGGRDATCAAHGRPTHGARPESVAADVGRDPLRRLPLLPGRRFASRADRDRTSGQHRGGDGGHGGRRPDRGEPGDRCSPASRPGGGAEGSGLPAAEGAGRPR